MADLNELRAKYPGYDDDLLLAANDMEEAEKTLPKRPNLASEGAMRAYMSDLPASGDEDRPIDMQSVFSAMRGEKAGAGNGVAGPDGINMDAVFAAMQPRGGQKDPGYMGDLGRGIMAGAKVQLPKMAGQALKFFGAEETGDEMIRGAEARNTADIQESAAGQAQDSPFSIRGNVYEAGSNAVPSVLPGAAGAGIGFLAGGPIGALVGYAAGSLASLPMFYGSQAQESYEAVKANRIANGASEQEADAIARQTAHIEGSIEAGGELVADVIPFAKLFKPFAKPVGSAVVKGALVPTMRQFGKTVLQTEAGEVGTEMAQQAGEDWARQSIGGTGEGATWDETAKVIMPTALMSLIPGMAGAGAKYHQQQAALTALSSPETDPDLRGKIALGAAAAMQDASPDVSRAFAGYAADQIKAGMPIEIGDDSIYLTHSITSAKTVDEAIKALPLLAGESLVVFPDGSTMTGAEAEAKRLADMQQPVDYPTAEPINRERAAGIEAERDRLRGIMGGMQERAQVDQVLDSQTAAQRQAETEAAYQRHFEEANAAKEEQIAAIRRQALEQQAAQAETVSKINEPAEEPTAMQLAFQRAKTPEVAAGPVAQPVQEPQNGLQVQEAAPVQEVALPDNPPALTVKRNGKGTITITGNADTVMAAEARLREAGIQVMRRNDYEGGVFLAVGRSTSEKQVRTAIDLIYQEQASGAQVQDAQVHEARTAGPGAVASGGGDYAQVQPSGEPMESVGETAQVHGQSGQPAIPVPGGDRTDAVAFNRRPDGTITVKGFTQAQIKDAAGAIGARVQVGANGNAIFGKGTDLAKLKKALGAEANPAKKPQRKLTGNLRNDLNILAPGLYNEVAKGGDGENNSRDMSLVAEYLRDAGYVLPEEEKPSDAVVEMIRQDFANGGGTVNAERMVKAHEIEESKKHRREVMAAADEYGIETRDGIKARPLADIEADVAEAIEHEVGVAGRNYASVRTEALKAGIPEEELANIEDPIADRYYGTGKQDADVLMYREMANAIQERIDAQESEDNARQGPAAESDQGVFELAGQTEGEARAEAGQVEPEITREQIDREATAPFSLQQESQPSRDAVTGGQGGLFTPDGRVSQQAKPASEMTPAERRPYKTSEDRDAAIDRLQAEAREQGLSLSRAIKDAAEFGAPEEEIRTAIAEGEDAVDSLAGRYAKRNNGLKQGFGPGNNDAALREKATPGRTEELLGRGFYDLPENQRAEILKMAKTRSVDAFESLPVSDRRRVIEQWLAKQENVSPKAEESNTSAERVSKPAKSEQVAESENDRIYTIEAHKSMMDRVRAGEVTADEFKAAFDSVVKSKDMIESELSSLTKDKIFEQFPGLRYRYKSEKKDRIVDAAYRSMLDSFVLGDSISWRMGEKYEDVIRGYVERTTDESLAEYANQRKAAIAEREQAVEEAAAGMENPETLDDFKRIMSAKAREIGEGATFRQAYMAMKPEWRAKYDELAAEKSRGERNALEDVRRTTVRAAGQEMEGQITETKHTRTGEALFVVKAAERVDREVYNEWNATAKRLGGWYSSYRGGGAVPGFQFKTRDNAEAFLKYLGGDTTKASETIQQRRDEFADDRSQTAVERLTEMADSLEAKADAELSRERKTNTDRRARMAGNAEAAANAEKAMASTMRNIASAIENKTAKFLNRIRQKTQIEMLQGMVTTAQSNKLRALYPAYADQEKHKGETPNDETADYADFPTYTAFRSDLASLARALSETEGTKKIGQQLIKVADDVSDAYLKFAKENLAQVSAFRGRDGSRAAFKSKGDAEAAIARSGYKGTAIVLPFKRGENLIVLSPSEAIKRGFWDGDNDKRITISPDLGAEIVEKLGKLNRRKDAPAVPWQFESSHEKRKRLAAIGIETPAEMRAALREFIGLREAPKEADKVKQLERSMVGRKKDGLDFFPTPASVSQEMIDTADIKDGMSILEPSAGMGHIADQIRDAGFEPDVIEMSGERRELLEAKGYNVVGSDFMDAQGSYDRIIMNPPFSDRRDAEHVQHAYSMLKPGGRLVAIMGEGVFFGSDKKAQAFRDWLESVGGTSEKLAEGTFLDPSLPVNTGVNARMVVIDKGVALESRRTIDNDAGNANLEAPSPVGEDLESAARVFLSAFDEGTTLKYGHKSGTARLVRSVSDRAFDEVGDKGTATREVDGPLGPFSGYQTEADVTRDWYGNDRLEINVWGKEQLDSGLDEAPALKIEVAKDGEFAIYGPSSGSDTFRQFMRRGWASPAVDAEGNQHMISPTSFWTQLDGVSMTQVLGLLGDIHARVRAWSGRPHAGLYWQRTTGATGGMSGRQGAIYLSKTTPERGGAAGGRVAEIESVRDRFMSEFKGADALDIRVVRSREDIPTRYRPSPYADGVYHDDAGLIYLVVNSAAGTMTTDRALQVLLHETVGHYGLMNMMGDKFKPILGDVLRVARAKSELTESVGPEHPDYATVEAVKMDYPEVSDEVVAQEVLARMAETGGKQSVFKIALMRIRQWLRSVAETMGIKADFTEQDARDLVALAGEYLRRGDNLEAETEGEGMAFASKRLESRSHVTGASNRTYTPEQEAAFKRTGRTVEVPTLKERIQSYTDNIGMKLRQGIADQFAPLEQLDKHAYIQARMSKAYDGALEALMLYGKVRVDGGLYNADMSGGVLDRLLWPLGNEVDDFMWWTAAKRAERLSAEDREHLFTPEDIEAMKALATGKTDFDYTLSSGTVTRSREMIYRDAAKVMDEFNKSILDIAEQSGLIDGESRSIWEHEFYVPFYRALEDEKVGGPGVKSGLVRQYAFKQLKGGAEALNHDLIANVLQNWAHLLAASAKNRAAASSLQAAKRVGVAEEVPAGTKGSVYYLDKGQQKHFLVSDPFLMDAISALEFGGFKGPVMKVMGKFKHYLTLGVTANPAFKIRNLIRDSIAAIGQSDLNTNPLSNIKQGFKATDKKGQTYVSMLASGGIVKFGSMLEGNRADHVRQLIEEGVSEDTILDSESKIKAFWRRRIKPAIEAYNDLGDRGESINRAALYEQMIAKGMSHEEASYAARDLLDFSMGGAWQGIRLLTQVVPFMNARIQGLYKLGRSDRKRLGYVVGAVSLASLALLAAYGDDDDWKKREDWDRDNFWWFKFGDIAFRIPKPFEIGAVGTLAERSAELFFDNEMTGKRYMDRLGALVGSQLAMNPVPQLFKPVIDIYANKDSFSGRPIETMGMEKLRTEDRFNARTSEVAKILGKANLLSPVQIDQAIRGYFGWLGTATTGAIDYMARAADDTPRPAMQLRDVFVAGSFVETLPTNSSRYVSQMYDQAKEIEEAWASFQHYRKLGETDKARQILEENRDQLGRYRALEAVKRTQSDINRKIQQIEQSKSLSPETKREMLDRLSQERDRVARRLAG